MTQNADAALDLVQKLDDTLNTYEPQAQQALTDARALSDTAQAALKNTHAFLSSAESLLKRGGPSLDDGTRPDPQRTQRRSAPLHRRAGPDRHHPQRQGHHHRPH